MKCYARLRLGNRVHKNTLVPKNNKVNSNLLLYSVTLRNITIKVDTSLDNSIVSTMHVAAKFLFVPVNKVRTELIERRYAGLRHHKIDLVAQDTSRL